jgi:predicted  nucleic acid-binding Zn-ribbon protein
MRISELLMLRIERLTIRIDTLEEDNLKKIRQIQDLYNEVFELRNTVSDKNMEIDRLRSDNCKQLAAYEEQEITIKNQGVRITELENILKGT